MKGYHMSFVVNNRFISIVDYRSQFSKQHLTHEAFKHLLSFPAVGTLDCCGHNWKN